MENNISPLAENCWKLCQDLSDSDKKCLIIMLIKSLKQKGELKEHSANDFYGIWGEDGMTDQEFVDELRSLRNFNKDIVKL